MPRKKNMERSRTGINRNLMQGEQSRRKNESLLGSNANVLIENHSVLTDLSNKLFGVCKTFQQKMNFLYNAKGRNLLPIIDSTHMQTNFSYSPIISRTFF
jgi:hypothetical protein